MSLETFWHLQAAMHARLREHAALTALLAAGADSLYDHVPPESLFPYIVMGEMTARPLNTQTDAAYEVDMTIYAYSRGTGMRELKKVMSACADALQNGGINVAGHLVVLCREMESDTRLESDGATRRGRMRFRLIVEPTV